MRLQENKVTNIALAAAKINGIIVRPGETFSFWRTVGKTAEKQGYKEGLVIHRGGKLGSGIGGGLCQTASITSNSASDSFFSGSLIVYSSSFCQFNVLSYSIIVERFCQYAFRRGKTIFEFPVLSPLPFPVPYSGIRPAGAAAQPAGVARSVGAAGTGALRGEFRSRATPSFPKCPPAPYYHGVSSSSA